MTHDDLVEMLADTASKFVDTVVAIDGDQWEQPGIGVWNVRELVGHTLRAFGTVGTFLDEPAERVDVESTEHYFRIALSASPELHLQVAERGREAGRELGDDPAAAVVDQVSSILGRLADTTGDEVGTVRFGGMRLVDYLDTRLVELVVHLSDICAALGRPVGDLGRAGNRVASTVFATASPEDRDRVLRAMLGRGSLPDGFSAWAPRS